MHVSRNLKDRKESSMQLSGVQEFLAEQLRPWGEHMFGLLKEQPRRQCAGAEVGVVGGVRLQGAGSRSYLQMLGSTWEPLWALEQGSEMISLMFAKDYSGWLGGEELARGRQE